ncbi:MAG TPA: nucleoside deaminase [Bacteroidales bacterium]|nr:nucleoside deaminase [Bacteroidales bacterium]
MEETKKKFMKEAIRMAIENVKSGHGGPFGAIVVKDGHIIGKGVNSVTANNDPSAHAEIVAIREACKNLNSFQLIDCEIYSSCEPCPMCLGAIYWARPSKVYYAASRHDAADAGFDDSFIYEEIKKEKLERKIQFIPLNLEESKEVFELWKLSINKIEY